MQQETDGPEVVHRHWSPPAPDVLVVVFGVLYVVSDGGGITIGVLPSGVMRALRAAA